MTLFSDKMSFGDFIPLYMAQGMSAWTGAGQMFLQAMMANITDVQEYPNITPLSFLDEPDRWRDFTALCSQIIKDHPDFFDVLGQTINKRIAQFYHGLDYVQQHASPIPAPSYPVIHQDAVGTIYDYGGTGRPVLLIPSLINGPSILDFMPDLSFVRFLAAEGKLHPYVVHWSAPVPFESSWTLATYNDFLTGAIDAIYPRMGSIDLLGYCMGGLMAMAAAQHRPSHVAHLGLIATPWNFHIHDGVPAFWGLLMPTIYHLTQTLGYIPPGFLQMFFFMMSPFKNIQKFTGLGTNMGTHMTQGEKFLRLEEWLYSGGPLATPLADDYMKGFLVDNKAFQGQWMIHGDVIHPRHIPTKTCIIGSTSDHIVPPLSWEPLTNAFQQAYNITVSLGHVGLMTSRRAPEQVWNPLRTWLLS